MHTERRAPSVTHAKHQVAATGHTDVHACACRELAKAVQTELAGANAVAEEALSSMVTVRSHAAEDSTRAAYAQCLRAFYVLQARLAPCTAWLMA